MHLSLRTVRYHLSALEEQGLAVAYRNGRRVQWYAASGLSPEDRTLISALRVQGERALLRALVQTGPLRFSDLQRASELPPRSAIRNLRLMMDSALVFLGDDRRYRLVDADRVAKRLEGLRLRFPDLMADAAREIFDGA